MTFDEEKQLRIDNISKQLESLECQHERTEVRYRLAINGGKMFKHQCIRCGDVIGKNWIPHSQIKNIENCLQIDDGKRQFNIDLKAELQKELREIKFKIENEVRSEDYQDYLSSPEWRERRQLVIDRCGGICEGCRKRMVDHVHHRTYIHYRNEFLFELVGLCRQCHERIHPDKEHINNGAPVYA